MSNLNIDTEFQKLAVKTQFQSDLGLSRYKMDRGDKEYNNSYYNSIIMNGGDDDDSNSPASEIKRTGGLPNRTRTNNIDRITFPTPNGVGYTFYITSSSTSDTSTGTGARKLYLDGLNANWDRMNEEITLTGRTSVATTKTNWLRINKMFVSDVGTTKTNEGDIFVSTVDDAVLGVPQTNIVNVIQIRYGYGTVGIFSVPRFHRLYFTRGSYYCNTGDSKPLHNTQYSTYPWGGSTAPNDKRITLLVGGLYNSKPVAYETGGSAPEFPCTDIEFLVFTETGKNVNYSIYWNTVIIRDIKNF